MPTLRVRWEIAEDFGPVRATLASRSPTESIAGPTVEGACARTGAAEDPNRWLRWGCLRGVSRATTIAAASGVALAASGASEDRHPVHFFPSASDEMGRQGFTRVINHSGEAGTVSVHAYDDDGTLQDPVTLTIGANETRHFNSDDLEDGNADKGLTGHTGSGVGDWRLELSSDLDIEVLSYVRTDGGFITSMHDAVPLEEGLGRVVVFNPASNPDQKSLLRLVNPGDRQASIMIKGIDDNGESPGGAVEVSLPSRAARTYTSEQLESGSSGLAGSLGDGTGKWRLTVESDQTIVALSLLSSPTGHLTNLSAVPDNETNGVHSVPLFPSSSDPILQGFVRVINDSSQAGEVRIVAYDDSDRSYDPVILAIGQGEAAHFNSDDLEVGNVEKGLTGRTEGGEGAWRLELSSTLDLQVLAYIRTDDGFLTAMHDYVPAAERGQRLVFLNPASNTNQVSRTRLVNPGDVDATVTITGTDDAGESPGDPVQVTVPAGASLELASADLESGGDDNIRAGAMGDGFGKWRLRVESDRPITAMSLLRSPTGYLSNLSTSSGRGDEATVVSIRADPPGPVEEGSVARFTVSRDTATPTELAVSVAVTQTGSVILGAAPTSLTIGSGATSATLTVATEDDAVIGSGGTVIARLVDGEGYVVGPDGASTVTVVDDDSASFAVTANPPSVQEGGGSTLTVSITNGSRFASDQPITLSATGSASKDDYSLSPTALTLTSGSTRVEATLTAMDDEVHEADETVTLSASHGGAVVGTATVAILASDAPSDDASLRTLGLSGVDIGEFSPDTTDYSANVTNDVASTVVAVTPNDTGASVVIADTVGSTSGTRRTVSLAEGANTITVTATAADGASRRAYTVTVVRRSPVAASFAVDANPRSVEEGGTSTVTVTIANGVTFTSAEEIVLTATGSASEDDYSLRPTSLTLTAGSTRVEATLTVTDDEAHEADETVTLSATHDGTVVGTATVTILASDTPSDDAALRTLSLSGVGIGRFGSDTTEYSANVTNRVVSTRVVAVPNDAQATVVIADRDRDDSGAGTSRTVSLAEGTNTITATVTAENETTTRTYMVTVERAPPVADAGWDLTVAAGETAYLDGSGSSGAEGTNWTWSFVSRPSGVAPTLVDGTTLYASFAPAETGTYVLRIAVGEGADGPNDTVTVTVVPTSESGSLTQADLLADTNRDGVVDSSDDAGEDVWDRSSGAVFGPNLDDDDSDGQADGLDGRVNGTADILDMAPITVRRMRGLNRNHAVTIELGYDSTTVTPRIFLARDGVNFELLIGTGGGKADLPPRDLVANDLQLYLDSPYGRQLGFDGRVTLTLEVVDDGTVSSSDEVALRGSPILFSYDLLAGKRVLMVNTVDNRPLRTALSTHLPQGVSLQKLPRGKYGGDRWAQDFMQTAYFQRPGTSGFDTVRVHTQLHRPFRPLAQFLPEDYHGADAAYIYPGAGRSTSLNGGGNVEIIPPHTHNGRAWPYGRIVVGGGATPADGMAQRQIRFFNAQGMQGPPIEVHIDWLRVGHVDEVFQVVRDHHAGTGERGWVAVIASTDKAIDLLQEASDDGWGDELVFAGRDEETTIDEILDDDTLMGSNEESQNAIDTIRQALIDEVGLTDADFREVPAMYYQTSYGMVSYFPAVQNLLGVGDALFVADPEGPDVDGADIWREASLDAFGGLGYTIRFVDVYGYHTRSGAIHCGTNVERVAVTKAWWDVE